MITGRSWVCAAPLIASSTCHPSMTGICTSKSTTSGCTPSASISSAVGPSCASTASMPAMVSAIRSNVRTSSVSSMMRTFMSAHQERGTVNYAVPVAQRVLVQAAYDPQEIESGGNGEPVDDEPLRIEAVQAAQPVDGDGGMHDRTCREDDAERDPRHRPAAERSAVP